MIIRLQHQRSDGDVDTYHLKSGRRYHIGRGSACEVRILDLKLEFTPVAGDVTFGDTKEGGLISVRVCTSMDADKGGTIHNGAAFSSAKVPHAHGSDHRTSSLSTATTSAGGYAS